MMKIDENNTLLNILINNTIFNLLFSFPILVLKTLLNNKNYKHSPLQ